MQFDDLIDTYRLQRQEVSRKYLEQLQMELEEIKEKEYKNDQENWNYVVKTILRCGRQILGTK